MFFLKFCFIITIIFFLNRIIFIIFLNLILLFIYFWGGGGWGYMNYIKNVQQTKDNFLAVSNSYSTNDHCHALLPLRDAAV